jgi:hypothetical protein
MSPMFRIFRPVMHELMSLFDRLLPARSFIPELVSIAFGRKFILCLPLCFLQSYYNRI